VANDDKPCSQLRSRRIPFTRRVLIAPKDDSDRRYEDVFDLSLGGMFVSTFLPLKVGETFGFEMQIDRMTFPGSARVVWTRPIQDGEDEPAGMAAAFFGLTTSQKRLLHREITNYTRGGGKLLVGVPPSSKPKLRDTPGRAGQNSGSPVGRFWHRLNSLLGR